MEHTKGKATVSDCKEDLDSYEVNLEHSKGIDKVCRTTFNLFFQEEAKANAELIADAFNTTNESGLTPSQLHKQNQELLEALITINGKCADASNIEYGKLNIGEIAKISITAINNAKTK
jgi:hypothetical protein